MASDSAMFSDFDRSRDATDKRSFLMLGVTRKLIQKKREDHANMIEQKKHLPHMINKICPSPTNPDMDCFAMTLEIGSSYAPKNVMAVDQPNTPLCFIHYPVYVEPGKVAEAVKFYTAAFGAQRLSPKGDDNERALLRIYSGTFLIGGTNEKPASTTLSYLLTDDVDRVLKKAVKAGASVLGKVVQVYSTCRIWCSLVRLNDPYGNQWIIYSRLCPSCLLTFGMLA